MHKIQMQFIPGYDGIQVYQLNPEDAAWGFDNEEEAISKLEELQSSDPSGRQYQICKDPVSEISPE